jgi:hypothetical protein
MHYVPGIVGTEDNSWNASQESSEKEEEQNNKPLKKEDT